jgi:hypothetical protein
MQRADHREAARKIGDECLGQVQPRGTNRVKKKKERRKRKTKQAKEAQLSSRGGVTGSKHSR